MLTIGLTGGIGSGKSTVSARLAERGAVVIDADKIAREVVEPGTAGLAAVVARFGSTVLGPEGALDRPALGRLVFGDEGARGDLEGLLHPLIRDRTRELLADAGREAIVVHDVPLLVEKHMGADYHLVVVVGADEGTRHARLVRDRGMGDADAWARIRAQASDEERRAAADVWLPNEGSVEELLAAVDRLWDERLVPYEDNLRAGLRRTREPVITLHEPDPTWPQQAARILARIGHAVGERAVTLDHIGSTSVPGLVAKDVIDLQLGVASLEDADEATFVQALTAAGYPRVGHVAQDNPKAADGEPQVWPKRFHGNSDPAVAVHLHVREVDSPGWRWALLFRDWLIDDAAARSDYEDAKRQIEAKGLSMEQYAQDKEPWFDEAHERVEAWAQRTGWRPVRRREGAT
ncbi:dephospho-CoA kinase [Janibacter sp. G56]|uniref:dephospho-CoA kinase n=1 Tax=Janibacter sp. G56 TaxID=3418717 RepID=UPI003D006B0C